MDPNSDVRLMQNRSMGGMGGKSRGRVNRGAAAHYRGQRNIRQRQLQHSAIATQQRNVGADIGETSLDGMMIGHVLKAVVKDTTDDGDWIDKLHHRYTSILFVVLAILVSTKQYVGEPINCWCPAHFSRAWVEYTNNICWISNTYYTPFSKEVKFAKSRLNNEIKYYQWIPLLISIQGIMFYIPRIVWKALSLSAGIDVSKLVNYLTTFESVLDPDRWEKTLSYTAVHLDRFCNTQRDLNTGLRSRMRRYLTKIFFPVCSRRYGNVLIIDYIMCKLLYLLNIVVQLFALDLWLGAKYHQYGIEVMVNIIKKIPWSNGHRFPQVTLCDFSTRDLGQTHNFTVQCVMTINIFNEKIYLFIWFWLVFVGIATVFNFIEWIYRIIFFFDRSNYIKKHLKLADRYCTEEDKKLCRKFIENYLKPDGVFVIRLISKNTNSILVSELVAHLWDTFRVKMLHSHSGNTHVSVSGEIRPWNMHPMMVHRSNSRNCDSPTDHRDHSSGGEDNSPTHSKHGGRTRQNSMFDSTFFFGPGSTKRRASTKYATLGVPGHHRSSSPTKSHMGDVTGLHSPASENSDCLQVNNQHGHHHSGNHHNNHNNNHNSSSNQNQQTVNNSGLFSDSNLYKQEATNNSSSTLLVPPPVSISLKQQQQQKNPDKKPEQSCGSKRSSSSARKSEKGKAPKLPKHGLSALTKK